MGFGVFGLWEMDSGMFKKIDLRFSAVIPASIVDLGLGVQFWWGLNYVAAQAAGFLPHSKAPAALRHG